MWKVRNVKDNGRDPADMFNESAIHRRLLQSINPKIHLNVLRKKEYYINFDYKVYIYDDYTNSNLSTERNLIAHTFLATMFTTLF